MLFIPLPFVLTLLLSIVLFRLYQQRETLPSSQLFIALISAYAIGTVLVGLRWGYDIKAVQPLMACIAVCWAVLAWLCFRSLTLEGAPISWAQDWVHGLPLAILLLQILLFPNVIDLFIVATNISYGLLLLRLARQGQNALKTVRLEQVSLVHKALYATAILLLAFAVLDIIIFIDIEMNRGTYAETIVTFANIPMIFLLGLMASFASQSQPIQASQVAHSYTLPNDSDGAKSTTNNEALIERLDEFMVTTELYKDPDLNLAKLARKIGTPTRQISAAVNQVKAVNVSQYVNAYRVKALCELLENSDRSIIQLQLETGFQTKSNGNREFLRVTGMSPTQWRAKKALSAHKT